MLDTDYTSFAVVWSCEPFFRDPSKNVRKYRGRQTNNVHDLSHSQLTSYPINILLVGFWIFSRNPTFPTDEAVVKRVDELVKKYADASKFEVPNQSDERCPRSY